MVDQIRPQKHRPSSNKTNVVGKGITFNIMLNEDANVLNFVGSFIFLYWKNQEIPEKW